MIETIKRCNICKSEKCDGKEYNTTNVLHATSFSKSRTITVCSSMLQKRHDETKYYRDIEGHGQWTDYEVSAKG